MTIPELIEKIKAGRGISGADALATEEVRKVSDTGDYENDSLYIQIAQAQLATKAYVLEDKLRKMDVNIDTFSSISGAMRQAMQNMQNPLTIGDSDTGATIPTMTIDQWNTQLNYAWGGIDTAQAAFDSL